MKNIFKIVKISRPLHGLVATIAALILTSATLEQISPIISKFIVDEIEKQVSAGAGNLNKVYMLIGLSLGIGLFNTLINTISERLGDHFAGRLRQFLTTRFYEKVLTLPQAYFDSELSGRIINQLNRGISSIQGFMNSGTNFIFPMFLQSIFTIAVLTYYNWIVALFVFMLFPIYYVLTNFSAKKWGMREIEKNKFEDRGRGRIQEVISNVRVVKSTNNEMYEWKFLENIQTQINKIFAKQSSTFHVFDFFRNVSLNLILFAINIVVFISAFKGNLSLGEMVLIIQLVMQARRPLFAMSFVLTQVQTAERGSKEFFEVLSLESQEPLQEPQTKWEVSEPKIQFKDVSFSYEYKSYEKGKGLQRDENVAEVLKKINLNIDNKEKVALVGESGAGKSTLVNLLLKFYSPQQGEIFMNDRQFSELLASEIRANMSLVFQDNELFSSTIRENVSYGKHDATEEEVVSALKMANAYEFVQDLPNYLDSEIGERGIKLSGGQKQRIQIARAILQNKPILILDEATSNLDSKSEMMIQEALNNLMKDKLVIIIAHRLSTIQNVDKVVVIEGGTIVDQGPPGELAKKEGLYSTLLKYQIEGNKKLLKNYELY